NLEYVIPKEGTNLWIDSWVVTNGAKNMENAHAWIDYMCRPESALANFDFITYSTPNTAARELIEDEAIRNSEIAYPDLSKYKLDVYVNLGEEADNMYNEYWMKVKSE
ncbi:MAG: extracellular solute-binding protein, partial [Butyrivibrio sp.]|nr:extracellular solute-binding protein [Butyrivibrio sp.]